MSRFSAFQGLPVVSAIEGTLLLHVPADEIPVPRHPIQLPEGEFRPKAELHVTVVGREPGARLQAAGVEPERLEALAASPDWSIRPSDQCWLLEAPPKPGYGARRYSVIQLVAVPDLAPFLSNLAAASGMSLPVPPPHLTWFTRNWDRGIGLDSEAEFRERRVRRLALDPGRDE